MNNTRFKIGDHVLNAGHMCVVKKVSMMGVVVTSLTQEGHTGRYTQLIHPSCLHLVGEDHGRRERAIRVNTPPHKIKRHDGCRGSDRV